MKSLIPLFFQNKNSLASWIGKGGSANERPFAATERRPFEEVLERAPTNREQTGHDRETAPRPDERNNAPGQEAAPRQALHGTGDPGAINLDPAAWTAWSGLEGLFGANAATQAGSGPLVTMAHVPLDVTQQVTVQLQNLIQDYGDPGGPKSLILTLTPEHLGALEVTLSQKGNQLKVAIVASSGEAEALLKSDLKELTDALTNRVGRFEQIDVKVEVKNQDSGKPDSEDQTDGRARRESQSGNTGAGDGRDAEENGTDQAPLSAGSEQEG